MILVLSVVSVAVVSARVAGGLLELAWPRCRGAGRVHAWASAAPAIALAIPAIGLLAGVGVLVPAVPWTWLTGMCACQAHPGVHLCPLHPPADAVSVWPIAATAALVLAASAWRALPVFVRQRDAAHFGALAQPWADGVWRLDADGSPVAFVSGLRQPRIVVEGAWWRRLSARERRVILAHETAHLHSGDSRKLACLDLLVAMFAPSAHAAVLADWRVDAEIRADGAAVASDGDPLFVAEVICRYARAAAPRAAATLGGVALAARIAALLDPLPPVGRLRVRAVLAVSVVMAMALGHIAHRAIETLL